MATCYAPTSISAGGSHLKACDFCSTKSNLFGKTATLKIQRESNHLETSRKLPVCAVYNDGGRGGSGDFLAGFLVGSAVCGTLAYLYAPQIRRSLLNEDESGFKRPKGPIYYDGGLEKTRQTLNNKINQLNSVIDNASSRLRGTSNSPSVPEPVEADPEVEATL